MSMLTLVRHGQASFFEPPYDRLSPTGEAQAKALGQHWARAGREFGEIYVGPCERHRRTAELAGAELLAAGRSWPSPALLEEFDEFDGETLVKKGVAQLAPTLPHVAHLLDAFYSSESRVDRAKNFQRVFEIIVEKWVGGELEVDGVESWRSFDERVRRGLARVTGGERRGRRVAVFSSVGPITITLWHALGAGERHALELGWRLKNGSVTEFVFSRERLTLDAFNDVGHLSDRNLWTYR